MNYWPKSEECFISISPNKLSSFDRKKNLAGSSAKMLFKVVFTNYVDKFLAFLNHLPPYIDILYFINVDNT